MLPEVGALEYLVIAAVALIVVGPKDLPVLLRRLGQFVARLRGMANEFRASFDEMARQSELDELRKEVEAMRRGQFADMASHDQAMQSTVGDIHRSLTDVGVDFHQGPETFNYDAHVAAEAEGAAAKAPAPEPPKVTISEAPPPAKTPRAKSSAAKPAKTSANAAAPQTARTPAKTPAKAPAKPRAPRAKSKAGGAS